MKKLVHAACALALLAGSSPSIAGSEARSVRVTYHDLDLTSAKGVSTLDMRVKRAAKSLCQEGGHASWERIRQQGCIRQATKDAGKQIERAVSQAGQVEKGGAPTRTFGRPIENRMTGSRGLGL